MIELELKRIADLLEILVGQNSAKANCCKDVVVEEAEASKPAKKAKAKKAEVVEAAPVVAEAPVVETVVNAQVIEVETKALDKVEVITQDDVREKLKLYATKHGIEKAKALLAKFGAAKVSDLSDENLVKFSDEMGV